MCGKHHVKQGKARALAKGLPGAFTVLMYVENAVFLKRIWPQSSSLNRSLTKLVFYITYLE